jgi:hypothetical protein
MFKEVKMVRDVHPAVRVFLLFPPGIIRGESGLGQGHKIIAMVGIVGMVKHFY